MADDVVFDFRMHPGFDRSTVMSPMDLYLSRGLDKNYLKDLTDEELNSLMQGGTFTYKDTLGKEHESRHTTTADVAAVQTELNRRADVLRAEDAAHEHALRTDDPLYGVERMPRDEARDFIPLSDTAIASISNDIAKLREARSKTISFLVSSTASTNMQAMDAYNEQGPIAGGLSALGMMFNGYIAGPLESLGSYVRGNTVSRNNLNVDGTTADGVLHGFASFGYSEQVKDAARALASINVAINKLKEQQQQRASAASDNRQLYGIDSSDPMDRYWYARLLALGSTMFGGIIQLKTLPTIQKALSTDVDGDLSENEEGIANQVMQTTTDADNSVQEFLNMPPDIINKTREYAKSRLRRDWQLVIKGEFTTHADQRR